MIQEHSFYRIGWDTWIRILILVSVLVVPFQLVFTPGIAPLFPSSLGSGSYGFLLIYLLDLFFIIDLGLNFVTSYHSKGLEIRDRSKTVRHYMTGMFTLDLIACFPFDFLFLMVYPDQLFYGLPIVLLWRLPRLLRGVRMLVIFKRWEIHNWINPGLVRIVKYCIIIVLIIHVLSCTWFASAVMAGFPEQSWVVRETIQAASFGSQYLRSLYWTVTTMTTVGYGDITPVLEGEYILAILVMMIGASNYAFMIGNIVSLFNNLDSGKTQLFRKIEDLSQYLKSRKVPQKTINTLRQYYEYQWENHKGGHQETRFDDLPESFRLDLIRHLISESLSQVPLFKECSNALGDELLKSLKSFTYPPGIQIAGQGEIGKQIFFLSHGKAFINSDVLDKSPHSLLEKGDYFGHMSLVLREKRTASVTALSYCEVFILEQDAFIRIKKEYPELATLLTRISSNQTNKVASLVKGGVIL